MKNSFPCNIHKPSPLSIRGQKRIYHPRKGSRGTAYRGTGSTDYRITQDSRKCKKKAGHIACSHAAICPVCAYSAFIQRDTCCFSFRSVYTKNAPHRRICTRKEAGGGQVDEEQLAGPAADDEAQHQPDAYCASSGSANRIRGQKIPPWVKLRVSFIKYPLNVKNRTRPERPPHLIRHCKRDHSPPMNKGHAA